MNLDIFIEQIKKTGFELEFEVSEVLRKHGWTTINNKYYIDDVQNTAREIDILAYKTSKVEDVRVYTTLVVSCKKDEKNAWALLAKEKDLDNPNYDWWPISKWTNDKRLELETKPKSWNKDYFSRCDNINLNIYEPQRHIFAYQVMNKQTGSVQNDTPIFKSVEGLMKAEDYEKRALGTRKKGKAIYFFNLLSVIDSHLIRIDYAESERKAANVKSDILLNDYIVNGKETTSRILFVTSESFDKCLDSFDKAHKHNVKEIKLGIRSFYNKCLESDDKIKVLIENFRANLSYTFRMRIRKLLPDISFDTIKASLMWDNMNKRVYISVDGIWKDEHFDVLNADKDLCKQVQKALKDVYRYSGDFLFDCDIPF